MLTKTQMAEWRKLADAMGVVLEGAVFFSNPKGCLGFDTEEVAEFATKTMEVTILSRNAIPLLLDAVKKLTECLETYVNPTITLSGPNAETMAEDMKELISFNARSCLSQVYAPESEEKE